MLVTGGNSGIGLAAAQAFANEGARVIINWRASGEAAEALVRAAQWLAGHWAHEVDGRWHINADPAHKRPGPHLYRVEEVLAIWRAITAPTLVVEGSETEVYQFFQGRHTREAFLERVAVLQDGTHKVLPEAGHMLHHDQPERLARLLEDFLRWWIHPDNSPDIITGWNVRAFDVPYLVTRLSKLGGEEASRVLSPWELIEAKEAEKEQMEKSQKQAPPPRKIAKKPESATDAIEAVVKSCFTL